MPPILRARKSAALEVSPTVERQKKKKSKPKRKVKQKPENSAPEHKVEKHEAESPEELADKPIVHDYDVDSPLSSPLTQPLHVTFIPEAQGSESENSEGPPFTFRYSGLTLIGGTFEQRASVIMAFLDSRDGSGVQNEPIIGEGCPN